MNPNIMGFMPKWQYTDNTGKLLYKGRIYPFRDVARQEFKPIYQDQTLFSPYSTNQDIRGNKYISFDGVGSLPFIWFLPDEAYYLVITDITGTQVIESVEGYVPGNGGGGDVTVSISNPNQIINGQFIFHTYYDFINPISGQVYDVCENWKYVKDGSLSDDTISFLPFLEGENFNIESNPLYYADLRCSLSGVNEILKDFYQVFADVRKHENLEITIAFYGISETNSTVELIWYQDFGAGGSSSVYTTIDSIPLTNTGWVKYFSTFTVPSCAGKTIGSNNRSALVFRMPLNQIFHLSLTNIQQNLGNKQLPFEFKTYEEDYIEDIPLKIPQLPRVPVEVNAKPLTPRWGDSLSIQNTLPTTLGWLPPTPVGGGIFWFTPTIPLGWTALDGNCFPVIDSPRLWGVFGTLYGQNNNNGNMYARNLSGNYFEIVCYGNGPIVVPFEDIDSGLVFNVIQVGDSTHPHIVGVTCPSGANFKGGESFKFGAPDYKWAMYFSVNGNRVQPSIPGYIVIGTPIQIDKSYTSSQVASEIFYQAFSPFLLYKPDTRGMFPRVFDGSFGFPGTAYPGIASGRDPDYSTRTAPEGGAAGRNIGTTQNDELKAHDHYSVKNCEGKANDYLGSFDQSYSGSGAGYFGPNATPGVNAAITSASGGAETRSKNFYFALIVKI